MEHISIPILFAITLPAALACNVLRSVYSNKYSQSLMGYGIFNAVVSLVCALTLFAIGGFTFVCSPYTLILGLMFGVATGMQAIFTSAALAKGPLSYTTVIVSLSTVITALSGCVFWNENLKITQIFGIVLMVGCLVLSVAKDKENKKASIAWFILCILACLCCGGVGILQKVHQTSAYSSELYALLIVAFLCSVLISIVICSYAYVKDGKQFLLSGAKEKKYCFLKMFSLLVVTGIAVALNNAINLYLVGVIDTAVFFPLANGGSLALVTLASIFLLKEKLTVLQWCGLALGFIAIILLCI